MPVNPNIALSVQPLQLDNPLAKMVQLGQLEHFQNQNQLANMTMAEKQRELAAGKVVDEAYQTALRPDGSFDGNALLSKVATAGYGSVLPKIQKSLSDAQKAGSDANKSKWEENLKKLELVGQIAGSVTDAASHAKANAQLAALGVPTLGDTYDPEAVAQIANMAQARKDQLESALRERKFQQERANDPFIVGAGGQLIANEPYQAFQLKKSKAGATNVSVDARNLSTQETEQSKTYGKTLGELRSGITSAGMEAPATLAKLEQIGSLLKDVENGTDTGVKVAQFANSIGLKLDPKLGDKEAAASITRELAGSLRKPGTGVMTDADFENFMQQVPGLSQSAEGRSKIIATMKAKAARDIEVAKLAREYAKRNNGVIDDGFMDVVSDYVAKNPVVQRESTSGRPNVFPDMSAIEAELARRKKGAR